LLVRGQESGIFERNFAVLSTTLYKQTIGNSSFAVKQVAYYVDALWARHAIFIPHESLLNAKKHSFPFLQKDQPEST